MSKIQETNAEAGYGSQVDRQQQYDAIGLFISRNLLNIGFLLLRLFFVNIENVFHSPHYLQSCFRY